MVNYGLSYFLGETTRGVKSAVFFDPNTPIWNNKPGGTLISGMPGSGKTFCISTMAGQSALANKTTVVIDPKGDFISLTYLAKEIGIEPEFWALANPSKAGLLDPFSLADDPEDALKLALNVIEMIVGEMTHEMLMAMSPIIKDVCEEKVPSMRKVMDAARSSDNEIARGIGAVLDIAKSNKIASILFAPGKKQSRQINTQGGLTIITTVGIKLPASQEEASASIEGRLLSAVLYLVTVFLNKILNNDTSNTPKVIFIDEAWAFVMNQAGADAVKSLGRLGRSKNCAIVLATQKESHLKLLEIEETISNRFVFNTSEKESHELIKAMKLNQGEGFEGIIQNLDVGECLMQDWMNNRYSTVQISNWNDRWTKAFETNPLKKLEN